LHSDVDQPRSIGNASPLRTWNDREPKYDLRAWSADGSKMGKGVTLTKEELIALKELLNSMEV
jgi:hypothetical protein